MTPPDKIEAKVEGTPLGIVGRLTATVDDAVCRGRRRDAHQLRDRRDTDRETRQHRPAGAQVEGQGHGKEVHRTARARLRRRGRARDSARNRAMTPFELVEPTSLKEAIALLDPDDPAVRPIGGGTALMLMMKAGVFRPRRLVSLRKVGDGFSRSPRRHPASLAIGAMTPLAALEHSPAVARHAPVIVHTMRRLSNVRVRNVATIGGESRAWRSAHGPAAGADRARRQRHRRRPRASAPSRSRTCSPAITRPRSPRTS